jgi:hypothetical protein
MALFLSSKIHQGDDLFSVQSRGKQCVMALNDWSKTTLNNILLTQGDIMYLQVLDNIWLCCLGTWCIILICRYNFT